MVRTKRFPPIIRRAQILDAAVALAERTHYNYVTHRTVAKQLDVTPPAISYYFKTRKDLQAAVYAHAITTNNVLVVAQGFMFLQTPLPDALKKKLKKLIDTGLIE